MTWTVEVSRILAPVGIKFYFSSCFHLQSHRDDDYFESSENDESKSETFETIVLTQIMRPTTNDVEAERAFTNIGTVKNINGNVSGSYTHNSSGKINQQVHGFLSLYKTTFGGCISIKNL